MWWNSKHEKVISARTNLTFHSVTTTFTYFFVCTKQQLFFYGGDREHQPQIPSSFSSFYSRWMLNWVSDWASERETIAALASRVMKVPISSSRWLAPKSEKARFLLPAIDLLSTATFHLCIYVNGKRKSLICWFSSTRIFITKTGPVLFTRWMRLLLLLGSIENKSRAREGEAVE